MKEKIAINIFMESFYRLRIHNVYSTHPLGAVVLDSCEFFFPLTQKDQKIVSSFKRMLLAAKKLNLFSNWPNNPSCQLVGDGCGVRKSDIFCIVVQNLGPIF